MNGSEQYRKSLNDLAQGDSEILEDAPTTGQNTKILMIFAPCSSSHERTPSIVW